jgi:hypothetical protein
MTLWLSHGICSYIRMYINAVAKSVMFYLQHYFYNIIFKITHKLCMASGSVSLPKEIFWVRAWSKAPTISPVWNDFHAGNFHVPSLTSVLRTEKRSSSFLVEIQIPSVLHVADCLHSAKPSPVVLGICLGSRGMPIVRVVSWEPSHSKFTEKCRLTFLSYTQYHTFHLGMAVLGFELRLPCYNLLLPTSSNKKGEVCFREANSAISGRNKDGWERKSYREATNNKIRDIIKNGGR